MQKHEELEESNEKIENVETNNKINKGKSNHQDCCMSNNIENSSYKIKKEYDPKYIYKNNGELIVLLEKDFQEIAEEINLIYLNNKEMMEYDSTDDDLLQAVQDNLHIILFPVRTSK